MLGDYDVNDSPVRMAIEAIERLMDEQEGRGQVKRVVLFRVFVEQRCVGGRAPFFLDADAAAGGPPFRILLVGRRARVNDTTPVRCRREIGIAFPGGRPFRF